MPAKKKKLQGFAEWGNLHASIEITECPKCGKRVENLNALGFWLSVCKPCKKFWAIKIADVTKELTPKFRKENLK